MTATASAPSAARIYRIEVRSKESHDPLGTRVAAEARALGYNVGEVSAARIYLIESAAPETAVRRAAMDLLADGVVEEWELQASGTAPAAPAGWVEVHLKPGVMDPVARSCESALVGRGLDVTEVLTGRAYRFSGAPAEALQEIANRVLANGVIETVHLGRFHPAAFEHGRSSPFRLRHVPIRDLDAAGLARLSREGHLFLSAAEMGAIQSYYREHGREPTDVELETLAQTWSEHCVHKTLKSAVIVRDEQGKELRRYGSLIRDTIFASTQELIKRGRDERTGEGDFCLSVFKDNAGVIAFDETDGVCFKVETHNRPSAIEPYGGASTGVGGVIRDVLGTGLGARPVANTDVFCVAPPEVEDLPRGVIRPERILQQVVAGVRDYGNRMGIPTVNGAVYYHENYVANPLVFCGCVGVIPRDRIAKSARAGDRIVLVGGRTGRDGIHGATFSSAELTDTHGSEFAHAVQIGNAITEKKVMDVLLEARDRGLATAVTDLGAGGLSSAVGEMGEKTGAFVELEKVPLKYAGLRYDEIWISEAQERMLLAVPPEHLAELLALAASEDVEATDIGHFGTGGRELVLQFEGHEVGRLSMEFLHEGIPMPTREAIVASGGRSDVPVSRDRPQEEVTPEQLLAKLAEPNIRSKHRIVRQYDHEVMGGTVVKPFVGPQQIGPADAAVIRPKLDSTRGVAVACGLAPHVEEPYAMAVAAIDEAVRNAVCVGADLSRLALLDNFCWPGTDDAEAMGQLVLTCEACRDVALAYGTPFISGKDSLHNQFTDKATGRVIKIPPTLLISAIGVVEDIARCCTSDLKRPGDDLWLVLPEASNATHEQRLAVHRAVANWIASGAIAAAHDVSDGGWLVSAAEMCIGGGLGLELEAVAGNGRPGPFEEPVGAYLLESPDEPSASGVRVVRLGRVTDEPVLQMAGGRLTVRELAHAWRGESEEAGGIRPIHAAGV